MDRRSFIGGLLTLLASSRSVRAWGGTVAPPVPTTPSEGGLSATQLQQQILEDLSELGRFRLHYLTTHPKDSQSHFVTVNTATMRVEHVVAVPLTKRHAVVLAPGPNPEFAVLPELDGNRAAIVNLQKGELVAGITTREANWYFSGHAVFSRDGKEVYLPEFPKDERKAPGQIVARAVPSLHVNRAFETGQYRPHNLLLNQKGDHLFVGHYGRSLSAHEPPSDGGFSLLKLSSGEKLPVPELENPYLALCHLERDEQDHLFISTRSWSGKDVQLMTPVLFGDVHAQRWESRLPEPLKDRFRFNFSLKFSAKHGMLAVAHLEGKMVSFWDAKARKLLGTLDFEGEGPLSVDLTPDERFFLVSTRSSDLHFIDPPSRKSVKKTKLLGLGYCPHFGVVALPS